MEIMIEFIVTLLVELFFDGSIDIFTNKRVSIPLRILRRRDHEERDEDADNKGDI